MYIRISFVLSVYNTLNESASKTENDSAGNHESAPGYTVTDTGTHSPKVESDNATNSSAEKGESRRSRLMKAVKKHAWFRRSETSGDDRGGVPVCYPAPSDVSSRTPVFRPALARLISFCCVLPEEMDSMYDGLTWRGPPFSYGPTSTQMDPECLTPETPLYTKKKAE